MDNHGSLDARRMTLQEITLIGCYTYFPLDLRITLKKLNSGALGSLEWVEIFPLKYGGVAFRRIHAAPKIILKN